VRSVKIIGIKKATSGDVAKGVFTGEGSSA